METCKKESLSHPMGLESKRLGKRRKKTKNPIPCSMRGNPEINHPKLTKGQKKFLGSVCTVYSTENMKKNIEEQYVRQLLYEKDRGIIKNVDWYKYLDYFCQSSRRKHLFQPPKSLRSTTSNRARSSFPGPKPTLAPLPPIPRAVTHHIATTKRSSLDKNEASHRYVTTIRRDESIPDVSTSNDITNRSITVIDDDGEKNGETKQDQDTARDAKASVDDSDDDDTESDDDDMEGSTFTLTTGDKCAVGSTANMSDPTTQQQSLDKDDDDDVDGSTSVAAAPELTQDDGKEVGDVDDGKPEEDRASSGGKIEHDDDSSQIEVKVGDPETAKKDDKEKEATKEMDDDKIDENSEEELHAREDEDTKEEEDSKEEEDTKQEEDTEEEVDAKEEKDAKEELHAKKEEDAKAEEDAKEEGDTKEEEDAKEEETKEEVVDKEEEEEKEVEPAPSIPTASKSDENVETESKTSEHPATDCLEPTADEEYAPKRSDDEYASSDVVSVSPLGEPTTNLLTLLEQPVNHSSSSSQIEGVTRPRSRIGNRPSSTSSSRE